MNLDPLINNSNFIFGQFLDHEQISYEILVYISPIILKYLSAYYISSGNGYFTNKYECFNYRNKIYN